MRNISALAASILRLWITIITYGSPDETYSLVRVAICALVVPVLASRHSKGG